MPLSVGWENFRLPDHKGNEDHRILPWESVTTTGNLVQGWELLKGQRVESALMPPTQESVQTTRTLRSNACLPKASVRQNLDRDLLPW